MSSPKSMAMASQMAARSISLVDRPRGLCVVHLMNVVLKTYLWVICQLVVCRVFVGGEVDKAGRV